MASRPVLSEEDVSCPVCLKIFEDPVVLCCSHSFCRACVNKWRMENPMQECPFCKTRSPSRNPPRNLALKNLCEAFSQQGLQTPSADSEEVCSLHNEKLQLFCLDHGQPVCMICLHSEEHADHSVKPINEAARHHKAEIQKSLEFLKEKLKGLQKDKGDCIQEAVMAKVQSQERERNLDQDFQKLLEHLQKEHKVKISALREEAEDNSQGIKERIESLNREIEAISNSIRDVQKQLEAPDVVFLQNCEAIAERTLCSLLQELQRPLGARKLVTTPTINITKPQENQNHSPVNEVQQMTKPATPEHTDQAEVGMLKSHLMKYACRLTLDPNTVNRNLSLSEENRRASSEGERQSYPHHLRRFNYYTQVLCSERLTGHCYWEVDWRGKVYVGVTYKGISRKGEGGDRLLGGNKISWVLECSGDGYTARHNNTTAPIPLSSSLCLCNRVAVYLDWPAGSLSFYTVSSDTLTHIHTFHCNFTKELLAGFWVGYGSVCLCQMK